MWLECVTREGEEGGHTVLPATNIQTIPAFTPQPQGVTALWLVLIAPELTWVAGYTSHRGRRGVLQWELNPDTVTHPNVWTRRRFVELRPTRYHYPTPDHHRSCAA